MWGAYDGENLTEYGQQVVRRHGDKKWDVERDKSHFVKLSMQHKLPELFYLRKIKIFLKLVTKLISYTNTQPNSMFLSCRITSTGYKFYGATKCRANPYFISYIQLRLGNTTKAQPSEGTNI